MSTYRVKFTNALTDAPIDEFDLTQVSAEVRLGAAGAFSATIPIARGDTTRGARLAAIRGAGATAVYMYRNGALWWDGVLWTITRASDGNGNPNVTVSAATWESYLDRVQLGHDLAPLTSTDQLAIAKSLIDDMQSDPYANMGLVTDVTTSGVTRDRVLYLASARPSYLKMLTDLATLDNGFDFMCQATVDSNGHRTRRVRLGYPMITSAISHRIAKPGAILQYSLPEDGTRSATYVMATGSGAQSTVHVDTPTLATGYPRLDLTTSYGNITDPAVLNAHATADLALAKTPNIVPVIRVRLDDTDLTPQCLGDQVRVSIGDELYPAGFSGVYRLVGMKTTPAERGQPETCDLTLN